MPWIRRVFQRSRTEKALNKELQFHLERQVTDYIAAGMEPEEARRRAELEFGRFDRVKEEVRDARWETGFENTLRDFRYALRALRKDRRFAFIAVFALALGIGASAVVFSVFYNLMLNPFEARDPGRLVVVSVHYQTQHIDDPGFDYYIPDFLSYRTENRTFEDMVGANFTQVLYFDGQGTRQFPGAYVTANAFDFYGVSALLGRGLVREDGLPEAPPVFVISYKLWKSEFNGDQDVLGKNFILNDVSRTLVGVMPPRFQGYAIMPPGNQSSGVGFWLPITLRPGVTRAAVGPDGSPQFLLHTVGRLKPGVTRQAAAADLNVISRRLYETEFPPQEQTYLAQFKDQVQWDADYLMGSFKRILYALLGAVLILLLIACSNVANLLLVRATAREQEIAVRAAMGASRGRLVRQMLAESFVLAAIACALGCAFAYFGLKEAVLVIPQARISSESVVELNPAVLLFALSVTILTTFLCGLAPAFHASRSDLRSRLAGSGKGSGGNFRQGKVRAGLVIVEVALSIVLLVGAGLMLRTFFAITHVDLGFNPKNVLVVELHLPKGRYDTTEKEKAFYQRILRQVTALPGVVDAAEASSLRTTTQANSEVSFPGKTSPGALFAAYNLCSEGLFHTMGLRLISGRLLSAEDVDSVRPVAVVNQSLAHNLDRAGGNSIGRTITLNIPNSGADPRHGTAFEIVGIVADTRNRGVQYPAAPEAYLPYTVSSVAGSAMMVRTSVDPDSLLPAIGREVWAMDHDVSVANAGSLEAFLYQFSYAQPEFGLVVFTALATIALVLIVIGVFSVMAYMVSLQTHDIGVRMALGAEQSNILTMFLAKGMRLMVAGVVIGLLASFGLTRFMVSQIWGVSATDPWTFAAVITLVVLVGFVACLLPAHRASRVDPLVALRYE